MTKLEKAYEALEMLKNLDLPVSSEQLEMIEALEIKKIEKEISGAVKKVLTQKTIGMMTSFSFNVMYSPETGVAVSVANARLKNNKNTANETNVTIQKPKRSRTVKSRTHILRVTFPDGTIIEDSKVSQTLVKCIKKIGWAEVQDLNIMVGGMNLVTNELHPNPAYRRAQSKLDDEVYINTGSNTDVKYEQIKRISQGLKLRLKVEKVRIK